MSDHTPRPTLDEFLREEGIYEEVTAAAIKRVIVWQIEQRRIALGLSKAALAERMGTSRSQLDRFLSPDNGNVELVTLHRAAAAVGSELRVELV